MTKKTLISAITTALVVGAASTTFASANPFSDVPADSWAYDAVATLSANGVVDGYPDGTYQGEKTITRYEMAQIVARAMAKTDLDKADKALVDKLAVEFADELDNLGVRVTELEKKSDNVKWGGKLRYRYYDVDDDSKGDKTYNKIMFRLEPKAYIGNTGWTANARIGYLIDAGTSSNAANANDTDDNDATVDRIYVQGPLFGANVTAGKFGLFSEQGLVFDDRVTGVQVDLGSDVFKTKLVAGRYDNDVDDNYFKNSTADGISDSDITADIYNIEFNYTPNEKTAINAGYLAMTGMDKDGASDDDDAFTDYIKNNDTNEMKIWYLGGQYAFDNNFALSGEYAQNTEADDEDTGWSAELQYKGADPSNAGSWGAYAGYRYIEEYSVPAPTYDDVIGAGYKGYVVGASYVPAENILATVRYFDGESTQDGEDASKIFADLEFFF